MDDVDSITDAALVEWLERLAIQPRMNFHVRRALTEAAKRLSLKNRNDSETLK